MAKMLTASNGTLTWVNAFGYPHREDGPAIIYADGTMFWYIDGRLHREDGPAVIWNNGEEEQWTNGTFISTSIDRMIF